jgi:hypothetical protein
VLKIRNLLDILLRKEFEMIVENQGEEKDEDDPKEPKFMFNFIEDLDLSYIFEYYANMEDPGAGEGGIQDQPSYVDGSFVEEEPVVNEGGDDEKR